MTRIVTCHAAEALQIGDEMEVAILAIEGGQVQLGITAPDGRRLMRIDPVPLPLGSSEMKLLGLERAPDWPRGAQRRKD